MRRKSAEESKRRKKRVKGYFQRARHSILRIRVSK